jgi:membrane associated rhomboid family serine protease
MFFRPATLVVKNLLIINVLMYVATMVLGGTPSQLMPLGGGFYQIMAGHYILSDLFQPWQVITHMFMHGSIPHLFFNMFGVYFLGPIWSNTGAQKGF